MHLSLVQEQAIAARMALIVGAKEFDRLFPGVQFSEVDGDILFCFAMNEELAAEMEDKYALRISIVASDSRRHQLSAIAPGPKSQPCVERLRYSYENGSPI